MAHCSIHICWVLPQDGFRRLQIPGLPGIPGFDGIPGIGGGGTDDGTSGGIGGLFSGLQLRGESLYFDAKVVIGDTEALEKGIRSFVFQCHLSSLSGSHSFPGDSEDAKSSFIYASLCQPEKLLTF